MENSNQILQLCRLCLVKDSVNIPIFEEQGDIRQIYLKISSCLPVKVSQDDELPKKICDGCSYKLDMVYDFRNTSVNAEKQLTEWLGQANLNSESINKNKQPETTQRVKTPETFVKQEAIDPSDVQKEEEEDDKNYMFQQNFEESSAAVAAGPSATATSNEEEPPPKRAKRTAAVKASLALDQSDEDDDEDWDPITKREDESEGDSDADDNDEAPFVDVPSTSADDQPGPSGVGKDGVEAPFPGSKMKIKKENSMRKTRKMRKSNTDPDFVADKQPTIKREKRTEENYILEKFVNLNEVTSPLGCNVCSKEFMTHLDFGLHSKTHSDEGSYSCHLCDYKKQTRAAFRTHIKSHDLYKCEKCNKILKSRLCAYKHSKTHSTQTTVECELCGKRLKKQCLYMHNRIFHSQERTQAYKCPICDKEYVHSSSLRQHYSSFHKELGIDLSVICDICGMKLSCKAKLEQHLRTHTGEKPFACPLCPKRCISKDILYSHMRIHTGERPFECKYCGKKFAHSAPYRYHIKTHTGEKSYSCPICGRGFISKANMKVHTKSCNFIVKYEK